MKKAGTGAAVGFTVKSGWACAVLVAGTPTSPEVVDSRRIELSDPTVPKSRQPYHEGFGSARKGGPELSALVASVKRYGQQSVMDLMRQYRSEGYALKSAGIVVGSLIDPNSIGNEHIRIHALEGQLFRSVVEKAAARSNVVPLIWRERDLYKSASSALERTELALRNQLAALGKSRQGAWRAEQKVATLAAWLVLGGFRAAHGKDGGSKPEVQSPRGRSPQSRD